MKTHLSTLDINKDTPAAPLPAAVTGAKRYECDACKAVFTVHWGKHTEECPCCDMMCDPLKE